MLVTGVTAGMVSVIWGASGLHPLSAKDHRQALAETGATEQSVLRVSTASQSAATSAPIRRRCACSRSACQPCCVVFVSPDCCDGARRRADWHVSGADELRCIGTLQPRWIALPAAHGRAGAEC